MDIIANCETNGCSYYTNIQSLAYIEGNCTKCGGKLKRIQRRAKLTLDEEIELIEKREEARAARMKGLRKMGERYLNEGS